MATIREIIGRVDENKFNEYSEQLKLRWVAILDGKIAVDVLLMHPSETKQFNYAYPEGMDTEPLVAFPHDDIYDLWLEAQIDMKNGEYEKYQNAMLQFNAAYDNFVNWFLTRHGPETALGTDVNGMGGGAFYYITAYGLAVRQGFEGSLEQWLESLVGEKGEAGKDGCIYPGEGAYSAQGGTDNRAISEATFTHGKGNFVGLKGYYYSNIDFDAKTITLSTKQLVADAEGFQVTWEVGDEVSIVNNSKYDRCSTITAINGNVITVDSLPFAGIFDVEEDWDDYCIFVPAKPEAGVVDLGRYATAIGEGNRAAARAATAIGRDNIVQSMYGVGIGRSNTIKAYAGVATGAFNTLEAEALYGSADGVLNTVTAPKAHAGGGGSKATKEGADADGHQCEADGEWGLARNYKTKVTAPYAVALNEETEAGGKGSLTGGKGTKTISPYQTYLGMYNYPSTNHLFGIGIGKSDTKRDNAFVVRTDGDSDFFGHRLRNVAAAVNDGDAVNLRQLNTKAPAGYGFGEPAEIAEVGSEEELFAFLEQMFQKCPEAGAKKVYIYFTTHVGSIPATSCFMGNVYRFGTMVGGFTGYSYINGFAEISIQRYDTWQAIEWSNPPMFPSVEYRTTERWNGKPVYALLFSFGKLPNNTSKDVAIDVPAGSAVMEVIDLAGNFTGADGVSGALLGFGSITGHWITCTTTKLVIGFTTNGDASAYYAYPLIKYIKD